MKTETAHQEETIASVRADLQLRYDEAVEAKRIARKRELLEAIVRTGREAESHFQAAKARKKLLKGVLNDLTQLDADDDLEIQDLEVLLVKTRNAIDGTVSTGVLAMAVVPAQPPFALSPARFAA